MLPSSLPWEPFFFRPLSSFFSPKKRVRSTAGMQRLSLFGLSTLCLSLWKHQGCCDARPTETRTGNLYPSSRPASFTVKRKPLGNRKFCTEYIPRKIKQKFPSDSALPPQFLCTKPDTTEIHVVFGKDAKMSIEEPNIMQSLYLG